MPRATDTLAPAAPRHGGVHRRERTMGRPLVILTALFVISRAAYFAAGVRFDISPIRKSVFSDPHLLDLQLLQHHLIVSVWNLNSQPPLFNLFCGALLKLPYGTQKPLAVLIFLLLGMMIALSVFLTLVALRLPRWLAALITVVIIVDLAYVLYENWLYYAYPSVAFLSVSALCLVRYIRTKQRRWGIAFFTALALTALLNSTYQVVWLLAVLIVVIIATRRQWRSVIAVALLPLLVVVGWVLKDTAQVGTVTTSTWLGMNFARTTLDTASPAEIHDMVRRHILTPIAEVPPFSPVSTFVPRFTHATHTGVAAVDAPSKANGTTNFNNGIYAAVSDQYLHNDLDFIRARPGKYAINVVNAIKLWTVPSDEFYFVGSNRARISTWADLFDRTVLVRPASDPSAITGTATPHKGPGAAQLSYLNVLIYALAILGSPYVVWRRRRDDPASATTMAYLWVTIVYASVTTSLLEFGENQRFAMEVGPLPIIAAMVVIITVVRSRMMRQGSPSSLGVSDREGTTARITPASTTR